MTGRVIDRAIQAYGAEGVSQDTPLARMAAGVRTLRIADVCWIALQMRTIVLTAVSRVLMLSTLSKLVYANLSAPRNCTG